MTVSNVSSETKAHFRNLLLIAHYYSLRTACRQVPSLKSVGVKISTALLRYTDIIPADKAFYEAGKVIFHLIFNNLVFYCVILNYFMYYVDVYVLIRVSFTQFIVIKYDRQELR